MSSTEFRLISPKFTVPYCKRFNMNKAIILTTAAVAMTGASLRAAYLYDAPAVTPFTITNTNVNWYGSIFTTSGWYTLDGFAVYDPVNPDDGLNAFSTNLNRQIAFGQIVGGVPSNETLYSVNNSDAAAAIVPNPLGAPAGFPVAAGFRYRPIPSPVLLGPGTYFIGYQQTGGAAAVRDSILDATSGVTIDPSAIEYGSSVGTPSSAVIAGSFGSLSLLSQGTLGSAFLAAMPNLTVVPEVSGSLMALAMGGMLTGFRMRRRTVTA